MVLDDHLRAGVLGVTSRNGKIIRQEPSEWPFVAHNGPFPPLYFLPLSSWSMLQSDTPVASIKKVPVGQLPIPNFQSVKKYLLLNGIPVAPVVSHTA